jgi:hypothetical protein
MARSDDMRRITDHEFHRRNPMPGTITVGHSSVHSTHLKGDATTRPDLAAALAQKDPARLARSVGPRGDGQVRGVHTDDDA